MAQLVTNTTAWYRFTDRGDGDMAPASVGVEQRRRQVVALPWTWLRQAHGAEVVVVDQPGAGAVAVADASVTAVPDLALSVQVADCAPVVLLGEAGPHAGAGDAGLAAVGVAHAGWRGLVAGIIPAAVAAMRRVGGPRIRAAIGPCIHPECYEFAAGDLDAVASVLGDEVRGRTATGGPALDLVAGVRMALAASGVGTCADVGICTACSPRHWSHRAAGDPQRQALVACLRRAP